MADQNDRTGCALREKRRDLRGVCRHSVEEVGRSEDGEALTLKLGRYGVPARSVCPCSVHKYDRRLRHVAPSEIPWVSPSHEEHRAPPTGLQAGADVPQGELHLGGGREAVLVGR